MTWATDPNPTCKSLPERVFHIYVAKVLIDGLWDGAMYSMAEAQLGVICACLPAARQALQRLFPSTFSSTDNRSKRTSSRGYTKHSDHIITIGSADSKKKLKSVGVATDELGEGDEVKLEDTFAKGQP